MMNNYNKKGLKNYLVSFPRSGSNFFRYIFEVLTEKKTLGVSCAPTALTDLPISDRVVKGKIKISSDDFTFRREHHFSEVDISKNPNILLLLRNPIEAYRSHVLRSWAKDVAGLKDAVEMAFRREGLIKDKNYTEEMLLTELGLQYTEWFIENLEYYDNYKGKKNIIYFEDLIDDKKIKYVIKKALSFFEEDDSKLEDFMNNLQEHKKRSKDTYQKSNLKKEDVLFISKDMESKWWKMIYQRCSILYKKYIFGRYILDV